MKTKYSFLVITSVASAPIKFKLPQNYPYLQCSNKTNIGSQLLEDINKYKVKNTENILDEELLEIFDSRNIDDIISEQIYVYTSIHFKTPSVGVFLT